MGWVQNRHADSLVTLALSMTEKVLRLIKVELIAEPSISVADSIDTTRVDVAMISVTRLCWMDPIIDFLAENRVPNDEKEANRVHQVTARYWLLANRKLYRRSFGGPYLLCLHLEKINKLLAKLHDGVCGSHLGAILWHAKQ